MKTIKDFINASAVEIIRLQNPEYWGSEEEIDNSNNIMLEFEEQFGYNYEEDEDAVNYFAKATTTEIHLYYITVIYPKFK